MTTLFDFVAESNRIEGIERDPTPEELGAHAALLDVATLRVHHLEEFVRAIQPGAILRDVPQLNVRVGSYTPPFGGPQIRTDLEKLLYNLNYDRQRCRPLVIHLAYETVHPFTDGNGESGRALWLWHMQRNLWGKGNVVRTFLHQFYYDTLEGCR